MIWLITEAVFLQVNPRGPPTLEPGRRLGSLSRAISRVAREELIQKEGCYFSMLSPQPRKGGRSCTQATLTAWRRRETQ